MKHLRLVSDHEATGETAALFSQIRHDLGLAFTPTYYQALGYYPGFLAIHWKNISPIVHTTEFFRMADRLRAEAYTKEHNYLQIPDLCRTIREAQFSTGAQRELISVIHHFYYRDAVLLLISAIQSLAFEGNSANASETANTPHPAEMLKTPPPLPETPPLLVPEENTSPAVRAIFDDIRRTLNLPALTADYSAIARWPDFLREYWAALKPNASSPIYAESRRLMVESALNLAAILPPLPELSIQSLEENGISKEQITSLVHINEAFTDTFSVNLLNVTFAQIGLEGGNGRGHNLKTAA
jgi:hypothetical protein